MRTKQMERLKDLQQEGLEEAEALEVVGEVEQASSSLHFTGSALDVAPWLINETHIYEQKAFTEEMRRPGAH